MKRRSEIRASLGALKKTKAWEFALRFVFGGVVTALAGVVAEKEGPVIAGLFLAFPAILPASLTLVARHAGRKDATAEAFGAAAGSVGLGAFGLVVWQVATHVRGFTMVAAASAAWAAVSFVVWRIVLAEGRNRADEDAIDPALRPSAARDVGPR